MNNSDYDEIKRFMIDFMDIDCVYRDVSSIRFDEDVIIEDE